MMVCRYLSSVLVGLLFLFGNAVAATDDSGVTTTWGYKGNIGPARWGQLNSHFTLCAAGKEQSPININKTKNVAPYTLRLSYRRAPLDIMRDGATSLLLGEQSTLVNTGHGIQIDFHANDRETINYVGKTYDLIQFHFHSPSENQLHGESFPLEIHFVHQGKNGTVAVIAVFVKAGDANPALDKIINHLPAIDGKEHIILGQHIDPTRLLPTVKNYYSFMGSLTTPPCVEGVQWIVIDQPISASPAQIAAIRKAMNNGNARPVQPILMREVAYSKQNVLSRVAAIMRSWLSYLQVIDG